MQRLWTVKCDWDEALPPTLHQEWVRYFFSLSELKRVSVPRWIHFSTVSKQTSLHGFSDASQHAYAAVVYLRVEFPDNSVSVSLLAAKSKVAPLQTLSIPRLELSAALLLSRLMRMILSSLDTTTIRQYCWTDSTITLAWIRQTPASWRTFVANRVAKIQAIVPQATWQYVPTHKNPADCASRGITPSELLSHQLWWGGPAWLRQPSRHWPAQPRPPCPSNIPEIRRDTAINTTTVNESCAWIQNFSSWPKLLRIAAYVLKFTYITRKCALQTVASSSVSVTNSSSILHPEYIQRAKLFLLRQIQRELFPSTLQRLLHQKPLHPADQLLSLNPFLDEYNIIRVGGRLSKSHLPVATQHPVVLASHPIVTLLIRHHHFRTLHGGLSLTLASLREEFWILRARTTVRGVLRNCVTCVRESASKPTELMGELPAMRVNPQPRAFTHTGVDYAGPIQIKAFSGRGHKPHKAYISLFICMTTKAIHLELVHDYGSSAFIAAFRRFCARRGTPTAVYSDNGTNFQGADRELNHSYRLAIRDSDFQSTLATESVFWHFLPPNAPHFGGLWEAGVRRLKYHLRRCIGDHMLSIEEMTTLLCRIEASLNSRPLAPLTDSISDLRPLTPGHFLIGTSILAPLEPSVLELNENRLSRWQLVQRMSEHFWKRWSTEYLHILQQRPKWRTIKNLAAVGRLVLLREPNLPPCKWELGRIVQCHPGTDGLVRVVTVQTARSQYKRPLARIVFLPVDINREDDQQACSAPSRS